MSKLLRPVDDALSKVTMYQSVLWGLRILAGISIALSLTGGLQLSTTGLLLSLVILSASSYLANYIFSRTWRAPANNESYAITLLILFFILPPVTSPLGAAATALAGVLAMGCKYMLAYNAKHIFNPAAFAAVVLGLLGIVHATWWVGSSALWPAVLLIGVLVVRKIRRFSLLAAFIVTALVTTIILTMIDNFSASEATRSAITSSPLLFLGTIMLTEPATMPGRRRQQIVFGIIVGLLYALPLSAGPFTIYPETALVLGNLYAFAVNPRYRLRLKLKEVRRISDRVYDYVFTPDRRPEFLPGQYMEWTLPHKGIDSRGNRRTFSIASSPTEREIHMGVKFYKPSSSFKRNLEKLQPGDELFAGQIAGDFVMPTDINRKLLFLAAGIGVTPFRSMLKYIVDSGQKRDIVLIYAVSDAAEFAYHDVLEVARQAGVRVVSLLSGGKPLESWKGATGFLNGTYIVQTVPDYKDRAVYISGPNGMVESVRQELVQAGVASSAIHTDYFTGY